MKKYISLVLSLVCLFMLWGCGSEQGNPADTSGTASENPTTDVTETAEPAGVYPSDVFEVSISRVGYSDDDRIYMGALNRDKMYISSVLHLPVFKCDTAEELRAFNDAYSYTLSSSDPYDDAITGYDEEFFAENSLVIVYLTSGSGSFRYGVESIFCDGNSFVVHVEQTNNPEMGTDDEAGWLITVAVPDSMIEGCSEIDADFVSANPSTLNISALPEEMSDNFNFSITWGCFGQSSYDSKTGKLIKTTNATDPGKYTTYLKLTQVEKEKIYDYLRNLDPASYPTTYDPHDGQLASDPSMTIILTVRDGFALRIITAENIALTYEADNEKGDRFLGTCRSIVDMIEDSEEWKKLPDYEFYYD